MIRLVRSVSVTDKFFKRLEAFIASVANVTLFEAEISVMFSEDMSLQSLDRLYVAATMMAPKGQAVVVLFVMILELIFIVKFLIANKARVVEF